MHHAVQARYLREVWGHLLCARHYSSTCTQLPNISKFRVIDFNLFVYGFTDGIVQSHLNILTKRTIIIENFCREIDLGLCYCHKHM